MRISDNKYSACKSEQSYCAKSLLFGAVGRGWGPWGPEDNLLEVKAWDPEDSVQRTTCWRWLGPRGQLAGEVEAGIPEVVMGGGEEKREERRRSEQVKKTKPSSRDKEEMLFPVPQPKHVLNKKTCRTLTPKTKSYSKCPHPR